jgi:methyl-accepting chemotaxis protein
MSIAKRLTILMFVAVIALIGVAGGSLIQMNRIYRAANFSNENVVPSILVLEEGVRKYMVLRIRIYRFVMSTDEKEKARAEADIAKAKSEVDQALKSYDPLIYDDEDRRLLEGEKKSFANYWETVSPALELSRQGRNDEALKVLGKGLAAARQIQKDFEAHMHYNEALGRKSVDDGAAAMKAGTWVSIIAATVAILIVGGLALQIRTSVTRRLEEANRLADAIAGGDLSKRSVPAESGDDETGHLIRSMDKMREDLARTVGAIARYSDDLAKSAEQLSLTADQVSSSTQSQSGATSASAAAVEELTVSIDHVGSSADEAAVEARTAGELARESGDGVQAATQEISRVAQNVGQTAQQIQTLSEHIQQIGNITTVIRDIADQTNLLALNAAIEAARAGEQGRGFAVVADEVRKLAERTTLSIREISTVITTIQDSVSVAVTGMEENRAQVTGVVATAEAASSSMTRIQEATERVRDAIAGISEAMREQRGASVELSRNVESIAQMSEENSSAVASVADTTNVLVGVSRNLKAEVGRFSL